MSRLARAFASAARAAVAAGALALGPAGAVEIEAGGGWYAGTRASLGVRTFVELRDADVVKQALDYSCGPAALATVLRGVYREDIDERDIIDEVLSRADVRRVVQRKGFSLLDLKRFAEAHGYRADGYQLDVDGLAALGAPAIVPILVQGMRHFIVVRGFAAGRALISDPVRGRCSLLADDFAQLWRDGSALRSGKGIAFVVTPAGGDVCAAPGGEAPLAAPAPRPLDLEQIAAVRLAGEF